MPREPHPRGRIGRHPAVTRNHRGSSPREGAKQGDSPAWTKARASGARERGFESLSPYQAGVAQPQVEHASPKRGDGGSSPSAGAISLRLSPAAGVVVAQRQSARLWPGSCRFDSVRSPQRSAQCIAPAAVAQRSERPASNRMAGGSSPPGGANQLTPQEVRTISTKYDHNRFRGDE